MDTAARTAESIGEPVTAWRTWVLDGGHLLSPYQGARWEHGTALRARFNGAWSEIAVSAYTLVGCLVLMALLPFAIVGVLEQSETLESPAPTAPMWAIPVLVILFVATFGPRCWQSIRRKWAGRKTPVQPGMGTPGIYGLDDPSKLEATTDLLSVAAAKLYWRLFRWIPPLKRGVMVRGQVHMWGDTILHEEGVKSEYAYPRSLTDVVCVRCLDWLPIDEWDDADLPLHARCRSLYPIPGRYQYEPAGLEVARRGYGLTTEEGPA